MFHGLGSLTELEAVEIQPIEFEKIEKRPVASAAVAQDPEDFESHTPEEKRSSMAKVPAFILQLREQERKTEERRSSMAKVPDWLQQVRERNTMKPAEVQAISEEIKGAQWQTISGSLRQLSLTEQIKKQQAQKICSIIVGEICDNIVEKEAIREDIWSDFLDHVLQDTVESQIKTEQENSKISTAISNDLLQHVVTDIATTEIIDMSNDELSSEAMDKLLCQVLSTDVVQEAISEEKQARDSARLLEQKVR